MALQAQVADGDLAGGRIAVRVTQQVAIAQPAIGAARIGEVGIVTGHADHLAIRVERQMRRGMEVRRCRYRHRDRVRAVCRGLDIPWAVTHHAHLIAVVVPTLQVPPTAG